MTDIYFRTDGNHEIATGHLVRCLAIARSCAQRNVKVTFVVSDEESLGLLQERFAVPQEFATCCLHRSYQALDGEIPALLSCLSTDTGFHRHETDKPENKPWIFIDSYFATPAYFEALRSHFRTAYLDDLRSIDCAVDLVINYDTEEDCACYAHAGRKLLGVQYTPLREQFHAPAYEVRPAVRHVLLSTGGTDPYRVAESLLYIIYGSHCQHEQSYYSSSRCYDSSFTSVCAPASSGMISGDSMDNSSISHILQNNNADRFSTSNTLPDNGADRFSASNILSDNGADKFTTLDTPSNNYPDTASMLYATQEKLHPSDTAQAITQLRSMHYHILTSQVNIRYDALSALAEKYPQIHLHTNVTDVAALMASCDLAVSAGGTTLCELCAVGLPTISYLMAENQRTAVEAFAKKGLISCAGDIRAVNQSENAAAPLDFHASGSTANTASLSSIQNAAHNTPNAAVLDRICAFLLHMSQDYSARLQSSCAMRNYLDGTGACRIAQAMCP